MRCAAVILISESNVANAKLSLSEIYITKNGKMKDRNTFHQKKNIHKYNYNYYSLISKQTTKSRSQTAVVRNIPKKYAYNINKTKQKQMKTIF